MFIDEATIRVQGGRGGDGIISFISNRHNRRGGPDGGNGGDGGSVAMSATSSLSTLYAFRNAPRFRAGDGGSGRRNNGRGARGSDEVILVPVGTVARDKSTGELLGDLAAAGDEIVVARGGEGGRGNSSFTTSTRQAPRICERGLSGEASTIALELKLTADVGIIGYPNVGKSSLISRISAKNAKVADYPFTTVTPNLGVVDIGGTDQFMAVDIPGLIEGAHTGKGLGDRFLRHIERTRVLLHMVDLAGVDGRDPVEDYERINVELAAFSEALERRKQIVAGNKIDLMERERIERLIEDFAGKGVKLLPISVATGEGVRNLVFEVYRVLQSTSSTKTDRPSVRRVYRYSGETGFRVDKRGDVFVVEGKVVEKLVRKLNLDSRDAHQYLNERLERMGVLRELGKKGFGCGDHLRIGGVDFELEE